MFTAILAALGAVILVVVVVAYLYWEDILNWFRGYRNLVKGDKEKIAFTILENIKNGNYNVIQGIFDTKEEIIVEGRKIEAEDLDPKIREAHNNQEFVVYN